MDQLFNYVKISNKSSNIKQEGFIEKVFKNVSHHSLPKACAKKNIEVRSQAPSTDLRRSPSLPEGGKGFVQISMFLQRISFVSVI
ncbi:MAG: hypothetical protein IJY97_05315, partial [Clostridia bacterium]|nr:hypothetical protein [Clostridia bacterium]